VTRVATTKQRGIYDAVRWFVRALLVVAGVAVAWAIGSATASASVAPQAPAAPSATDSATESAGPAADNLAPVTGSTVRGANDATWGVTDLAGNVGAAASHAISGTNATNAGQGSPAGAHQVRHRAHRVLDPGFADGSVADQVSTAMHDFARDAVLQPVQRTVGAVEHLVRKPSDAPQMVGQALQPAQAIGKQVWTLLHPGGKDLIKLPILSGDRATQPAAPGGFPVGVAPAVPVPPQPPGAAAADPFGAAWKSAVHAHHTDTAGLPGTHGVKKPHPPRMPLPPLPAPVVPGNATAGGHVDGPLFGIPAGTRTGIDDAVTGLSRFGLHYVMIEPGAQPGVTPD
jgi:hypothetical protein